VCTSFYFLEGVAATKPIVDATAKEEKLSKSRLSICMNIFEDLCGMTTLGSLEVSPRILMSCTQTALHLTKDITRRLREAYQSRSTLSLLDFSLSTPTAITKANQTSAHAFLSSLFTGVSDSQNASAPDNQEELIESEVVQMLEQNKKKKPKATTPSQK